MITQISDFMSRTKMIIKSGGTTLQTAEVIFHAIFGTYLEDIGVLGEITTRGGWSKRKALNPVFNDRSKQHAIVVTPIVHKYVSKMAQSLLTKTLGNTEPCYTTRPSFNGKRKRTFNEAFKSYLDSGKVMSSYSSDPIQLQLALRKLKDELRKDMDAGKLEDVGNKNWLEKNAEGVWVASEKVPTDKGISFWGPGDSV